MTYMKPSISSSDIDTVVNGKLEKSYIHSLIY